MTEEKHQLTSANKASSAIAQEEGRLMQAIQQRITQQDPTAVLPTSLGGALPDLFFLPFGASKGSASLYRLVPASINPASVTANTPVWRIELLGLKGSDPLGFDIVDDVILGRGDGKGGTDIKLDPFEAMEKGVSRRHTMFRPTRRSLYILDMESTNGTRHNGVPLTVGIARPLQDGDSVTLGRLSFTIKIIARPALPGETPKRADPPTSTGPMSPPALPSMDDTIIQDTPGILRAVKRESLTQPPSEDTG